MRCSFSSLILILCFLTFFLIILARTLSILWPLWRTNFWVFLFLFEHLFPISLIFCFSLIMFFYFLGFNLLRFFPPNFLRYLHYWFTAFFFNKAFEAVNRRHSLEHNLNWIPYDLMFYFHYHLVEITPLFALIHRLFRNVSINFQKCGDFSKYLSLFIYSWILLYFHRTTNYPREKERTLTTYFMRTV